MMKDLASTLSRRMGLTIESEMAGGHQSRVFLATGEHQRLIVKCIDAVDAELVRRRAEFVRRVAEINPAVIGPEPISSELVTDIDGVLVIGYRYVEGIRPDPASDGDIASMATTLAALHTSMSAVGGVDLPPVSPLQVIPNTTFASHRMIHGDYATANLISTPSGLRLIDFDECGTGSVEFELGNSLYMVLFDAWNDGDLDRFRRFRSRFIEHYRRSAGIPIDDQDLDAAIMVRVAALERWLTEPEGAPVGIRSARPRWRRHLARFVADVAEPTFIVR